jgi:hypothetical protein
MIGPMETSSRNNMFVQFAIRTANAKLPDPFRHLRDCDAALQDRRGGGGRRLRLPIISWSRIASGYGRNQSGRRDHDPCAALFA